MFNFLMAVEFHDIAPPVDYSLVPPWLIFAGVFLAIVIVALLIRAALIAHRRSRPTITPRAQTIAALEKLRGHVDHLSPYEFSISVSDVVRGYVHDQFSLPVTRQTSLEFLNSIGNAPPFTPQEKSLLGEFLNRCDLIKFARLAATTDDSRKLLDEAIRFVKGGTLVTA